MRYLSVMTDDPGKMPEPDELDPLLSELLQVEDGLKIDPKSDEIDAEFGDRLKKFDDRLAEQKSIHEARKIEAEQKQKGDREATKGLGLGMSVAYAIIGVPVFGYGIGFLVDKSSGSTTFAGIGMLIGCLVGIAVAMVMLSKQK